MDKFDQGGCYGAKLYVVSFNYLLFGSTHVSVHANTVHYFNLQCGTCVSLFWK